MPATAGIFRGIMVFSVYRVRFSVVQLEEIYPVPLQECVPSLAV